MRRYFAIPLMLLYMTSISGAMIQVHFCGQNMESWTINDATQTGCDEGISCAAKKPLLAKKSCCEDKTLTLKIAQDHNISSAFQFLFSRLQPAFVAVQGITFDFIPSAQFTTTYHANAPPLGRWQDIPLFKLHQRFTYYG